MTKIQQRNKDLSLEFEALLQKFSPLHLTRLAVLASTFRPHSLCYALGHKKLRTGTEHMNLNLERMDSTSSEIISKCFVKPKTISQNSKEKYHLSSSDNAFLTMHYIQQGLLFLKPSTTISEDFMETLLQKLKDSLATTLVHFYPLAGRLSTFKNDNPTSYSVFVDCNNSPGAGFIHAKSDLSVSDVVGSKHVPLVVQSFFDHHKAMNHNGHTMSLLSVKVTELVDGVFIGLSMNHSIGDGSSFWQFFNSLSEIFNSQDKTNNSLLFEIKNPPIFRAVSGPICRRPFDPLNDHNQSISPSESTVLQERVFHFSSETVKSLKSIANQECGTTTKISSFQSLTAIIWISITRARKLPYDQETTLRFAAGTRSRMNPPLPENYFGVYLAAAETITKVSNLLDNEFGWVALKLHQAVTKLTTRQKISLDIDGLLNSQLGPLPNIVHIGSSPRFNMYGPEFGMGKAVAIRSGYFGKYDGKVSAYPGRDGGGSIDLEVCLLPKFMEALESDQHFMSLVSSS